MPEIRDVKIEPIREIGIPPVRSIFTGLPQPITNNVSTPVTVTIGSPIVNIPGCVEANLNGPGLIDDDPNGNVVLCDGQTPSFNPIQYQPDQMVMTGPPESEVEAPKLKDSKDTNKIPQTPQLPKPKTPNAPVVTAGEDKEGEIELVEEPTFVEQYLPSAKEVTTTVTIAVAAASAAVLGKPIAELILKLIKPLVKKIISKIQNKMGKKEVILSVAERRQLQKDLR